MNAKPLNSSFNVGESYVVSTVPFNGEDFQILTVTKITPKMIRFEKDIYFAARGDYYYGTGLTKSYIVYDCTPEELADLSSRTTSRSLPNKAIYSVSQYSLRLVREKTVTFADSEARITKPTQAVEVAIRYIGDHVIEHLMIMALSIKNEIMGVYIISIGSNNECVVKMGEIARTVLMSGCSSFIMAHNHPSGDCTPSPEDVHCTSEVLAMCRLLDLDMLDHLIVSSQGRNGNEFFSFREKYGDLWDRK